MENIQKKKKKKIFIKNQLLMSLRKKKIKMQVL